MTDAIEPGELADQASDKTRREKRRVGKAVGSAKQGLKQGIRKVRGPSPNESTNLLIADVGMRVAMILFRRSMERGLLSARFDEEKARAIIEGRPKMRALATAAVARQASKSVPGMVLLGGGLLAKVAFDRGRNRRKARAAGDKALNKMARNADGK
ncbi:hypothetical protein FHS61_001396 [Altererythrobacter atlanticus]|uniref:Uncharacterized protein n=1 Tax=Croceibacterium atlanticum TaxID=1267766 RepID=A0A0F7KUR1_9SPHN|nr:hypothetical protein [Croceibacterium atlanticum]AKH44078.1 hypothetical protein WYH_03058 [Croceibacterium atlanticum]MBB5732387.1 hypothetical protein [Croceibacterium atlanticum]